MRNRKKILLVVGARPTFMKIAPLLRELAAHSDVFNPLLAHTGQHYDSAMSGVFFRELEMPEPGVNLGVGSGSHARQTAQVMMAFEPVLADFQPDWVVVPGDVNSTLACALVAAKLGVRVAHLEAGLRSFDRAMPEEINRVLTDQLADLLLTPSADADRNLLQEGVNPARIHLVGNIMIDTLMRLLPKAETRRDGLERELGIGGSYVLATLHRPSNVDEPAALGEILGALNEIAADERVLFPVHPRTRERIARMNFVADPRLTMTGPLGYLDFLALERSAALVITDSGGVQEETTFLGVPCLTVRANTERPVTIAEGTNTLVASRRRDLVDAAGRKLIPSNHENSRRPPLWDGATAQR